MQVTRRQLVTGVSTLCAAALAGCGSDSTGDGATEDGGDGGDDGAGEDGGGPPLATYRQALVDELDIEIATLDVEGGTVSLRYASRFETDTERLGYEVGFISGRFGRQVADGWDVDQLAAQAATADDRTVSWSVDAETAVAFVNDEITVDEFIDRVFGTLTVE